MKNPSQYAINELFRQRWSPYVYDTEREVRREDLQGIFEAARWAMSAFNAQPWRYIVGVRGRTQETWNQVFESLLEGNQGWTKNVPVLALGLAERNFEHNGKTNKTAFHDLGAASATLSYEAASRGLAVHQMSGINPDRARELFELPDSLEPFTVLAFANRDRRPRERKAVEDLIVRGGF